MQAIEARTAIIEVPGPNGTVESVTLEEARDRCLRFLEKSTNPDEILDLKRMVVQLTAVINPDDVEGLYGIHIVERKETRPVDEGCCEYTVGHDVDIQAFHDNMFATYLQSDIPTPEAYALYLQLGFIPTHIGRVTERGTVISRWGPKTHVYEHEPQLVPLSYGQVTYFSSDKKA